MRKVNLLFTSAGKRVVLLNLFRKAVSDASVDGKIYAVDASEDAAARYVADKHFTVPRVDAPNYIEELLSICKKCSINILIPLIDTELQILAANKERFDDIGVTLLLSSKDDVDMCCDKRLTSEFFLRHGFNTPLILDPDEVLSSEYYDFPLFIKPADGSASVNAFKVNSKRELELYLGLVPNPILQEFAKGQEYTIDVLADFSGRVRCVVPRFRIDGACGYMNKGFTVKDQNLINATKEMVEKMSGPLGCITVQCFLTEDKKINFFEINPRFGGGYPLAYSAGANYPLWILLMYLGDSVDIVLDGWRDNVKMLRYHDCVFLNNGNVSFGHNL